MVKLDTAPLPFTRQHPYQPMIQERDAGPAWDCETIVSTFSNLDNHPSVIAEPSLRGRKKKGAKEAASGLQGACVCGRGKGGRERRTVV